MKLEAALNDNKFIYYLDNSCYLETFNLLDIEDCPKLLTFLIEEGYKNNLMNYISKLKFPSKVNAQHHGYLKCSLDDSYLASKYVTEFFRFLLSLIHNKLSYDMKFGDFKITQIPDVFVNPTSRINDILFEGSHIDANDLNSNVEFLISFYTSEHLIEFHFLEDGYDYYTDDLSMEDLENSLIADFNFILRRLFNTFISKVNYMIKDM